MSDQLKVGITGGIGSGKTIVCRLLERLEYPVYYADSRSKQLMDSSAELIDRIVKLFGEQVKTSEGKVDKRRLAKIVFGDQEKLVQLNSIMHPAVEKDFVDWCTASDAVIVFKEAAVLFETGNYKKLDLNVLITTDARVRVDRIKKRDPFRSVEQIKEIMDRQMKDGEKELLANYIIENNPESELLPQVFGLLELVEAKLKG